MKSEHTGTTQVIGGGSVTHAHLINSRPASYGSATRAYQGAECTLTAIQSWYCLFYWVVGMVPDSIQSSVPTIQVQCSPDLHIKCPSSAQSTGLSSSRPPPNWNAGVPSNKRWRSHTSSLIMAQVKEGCREIVFAWMGG